MTVPIILLGGININTQYEDFFKVLNFQIVYPNGRCVNFANDY